MYRNTSNFHIFRFFSSAELPFIEKEKAKNFHLFRHMLLKSEIISTKICHVITFQNFISFSKIPNISQMISIFFFFEKHSIIIINIHIINYNQYFI